MPSDASQKTMLKSQLILLTVQLLHTGNGRSVRALSIVNVICCILLILVLGHSSCSIHCALTLYTMYFAIECIMIVWYQMEHLNFIYLFCYTEAYALFHLKENVFRRDLMCCSWL